MRHLRSFFKLLAISRIAIFGATLTTFSFLAYFTLLIGELFIFTPNPYWGLVLNMVFPAIALVGLIIIAVGILLRVRTLGAGLSPAAILAAHAEREQISRRYVVQVVIMLTIMNVPIFGLVSYHGYHFTESREFCGELCHVVMHPELHVYRHSPHSEVNCVACHIGEGATWFVKSKLSGMRQVYGVLTDNFSRPISTPVHNLRPARDVCEVCHRPEIFHGNSLRVIQKFAPDLENTRTYTVLNMHVGGGGEGFHPHGIHWHVSRDHVVRYYASDAGREKIDRVELTTSDGKKRVWTRPTDESTPDYFEPEPEADHDSHGEFRTMDCIDCHNRPTHIYLDSGVALDRAMTHGDIDPAIPWIRKFGQQVITQEYETKEEAFVGIAAITKLYEEREPEVWRAYHPEIEEAVVTLKEIYDLYVYPHMKIRWNTYPSLIGHPTPSTGACFRCHDGILRDEEGETIRTGCETCHFVLAREERDPVILKMLIAE